MNELIVEKVLRAVECIPAGRATTYGQVGRMVGTGARQVGQIMAQYGGPVPWWRVVNARGELPARLTSAAQEAWNEEGFALVREGRALNLKVHAVDVERWADAYEAAIADMRRKCVGSMLSP